jgi:hypothetical protein
MLTMSRPLNRCARDRPALAALALLAAVVCSTATPVGAEPRVAGRADAVSLEADEASLADVLAALGAAFDLRYRTSVALDRSVSGRYHGPLQRVLPRLLRGYNFIIKTSGNSLDVVVFGADAAPPATERPAARAESASAAEVSELPAASAALPQTTAQ